VASLSQGRTAAAQCGLFTHKSVPVIFEPPCIINIADIVIFFEVSNLVYELPKQRTDMPICVGAMKDHTFRLCL